MLPLSDRASALGTENAFVVLKEVLERIAGGVDIKNFCIGQPDFVTPDHIRMAAIRALLDGKTGYTPSAGIPELRAAVAETVRRTRGLPVSPDDVVVACGAKPFIGYAVQSVTDPGQGHEVVYPVPGFPIYESQIRAQGAVPVPLPLREHNGYRLDPHELERMITPRTRLLILNSPHNPTGSVLDRATLESIAAIVSRWPDVWIFSDEPYSSLVYDEEFTSIASVPGMAERTLIVDGASKTYAMPGWRIGWCVNARMSATLARWVTNTESCAPHVCQWAVVEALTGSQRSAVMMRQSFRERRDRVFEGLNSVPGVRCLRPAGAFYAWANVTDLCRSRGVRDSEELRRELLDEAAVAVLADGHFGSRISGEGEHVRLSFAASIHDLDEGIARLNRFARAQGGPPRVEDRAAGPAEVAVHR